MKTSFLNSKEVQANIVTAEKIGVLEAINNSVYVAGPVYLKTPDTGSKTLKVMVQFTKKLSTNTIKDVKIIFDKGKRSSSTNDKIYAFVRKYLPLIATAEHGSIAILNYKYASFAKEI